MARSDIDQIIADASAYLRQVDRADAAEAVANPQATEHRGGWKALMTLK